MRTSRASRRVTADSTVALAWAALATLLVGGCAPVTGVSVGTPCTTGMSVACACDNGRTGAQRCSAAGTFEACSCQGSGDAGAGDSSVTIDGAAPADDAAPGDDATELDAEEDSGEPVEEDSGGPPVEDPGVDDPPGTYTFVFASVTIDATSATTRSGFNLDGFYSQTPYRPADCSHADAFSLTDRDQHCALISIVDARCTGELTGCSPGGGCRPGVDNQLPEIVDMLDVPTGMNQRADLASDIAQSRLVILARLTGVEGEPGNSLNDSNVQLALYAGYPAFSAGCDALAPDRVYRVSAASLRPLSTSVDQPLVVLQGRIVNGRVQVAAAANTAIPLPGTGGAVGAGLLTERVQLRFNLGADRAGSLGNAGGMWQGSDVYNAIVRAAPSLSGIAARLVGERVDVQVGGVCAETNRTPPRFGGIGIGYGFTLLPARVAMNNPVADGPMSGACGSSE